MTASADDPTRAASLIRQLHLQPHPEGGFYAEVHRSASEVAPLDGRPRRAALTAIYFLLVDQGTSRWHRVRSDEVWCHLEGAPLWLYQLDEATHAASRTRLGPVDTAQHTLPQATVPAGLWQAAHSEGAYTLVACMVAPGFDFADFTLMDSAGPLAGWLQDARTDLAALI